MKKRLALSSAMIALVALISYLPALKIDFIVNDWWFLSNAIRLNFQQHLVQYFDPRVQTYGFRPLQGFQFFVEYRLFGDNSAGYHLIHILLHLSNALLLFALVTRLSRQWQLALLSALLFATLPAYSLAVMWVGVADVVAVPFFLTSILFWVIFLQTQQKRFYWLAVGAFAFALMGKESSILVPVILVLVDFAFFDAKFDLFQLIRRYSPFAILLIPYLLYEYRVQQTSAFVHAAGYSLGWHALSNFVQYLAVLAFPWLQSTPNGFINYLWLFIVAVLFIVIIVRTHSKPLAFLGFAAVLGTLPVLGFQPIWFDPRYLYLSGTCVAVLYACVIQGNWKSFNPKWRTLGVSLALVGILIVNGGLIADTAANTAEVTRQRRVPFRTIARLHPTFASGTYLYFTPSPEVPPYDLYAMFLLHYGKDLIVEGVDNNQVARWRDFPQAYLYYFDESAQPIEVPVDPTTQFHSTIQLPVSFQAPIRLEGYALPRQNFKRGETAVLLLYWRGMRPIDKDYTVFVHLLDERGQLVDGFDAMPRGGKAPTSSWRLDELVVDAILMPLTKVPAGKNYRIAVGLYYLPTQERVNIVDATGQSIADAFVIESLNMDK
jgi:hypothetical protein